MFKWLRSRWQVTSSRTIVLNYQGRVVATASSDDIQVIQNAVCRLFDIDLSKSSQVELRTKFKEAYGEELILVDPELWPKVHTMIKEVWVGVPDLPHPTVDPEINAALSMFPTPSAEETIFIFIKYPSGTTHTFGPLSYTWPLYFLTHVIEQHEGTPASWQRLTLDGKRILDTDPGTLASVGIKNHSVLELSIVPIKRRAKKPVIYIYPPKEMEVSVEVELKGAWEFETVYPVVPVEKALTGGRKGERILWEVVARRDGTMTEKGTGLEISYLYWEALVQPRRSIDTPPASRPTSPTEILDAFDAANPNLTSSNSILLHTSSVPAYLDKTLKELGLNVEARTSFITFWLPSFQPHTHIALLFLPQSSYSAAAPLTITPKPDEVLRVFMLFKGINEQNVSLWDAQRTWDWREIVGVGSVVDGSAERFRVVEWGGMEVS